MALARLTPAQGRDLLRLLTAKQVVARPLGLAYGTLEGLDDVQLRRQLLAPALLSGSLTAHLRQTWGKRDGVVPLPEGKRGQVFFFRQEDDVVMALTAPLPRGTTWWWITQAVHDWPVQPYPFDAEAVQRFWPAAVDDLIRAWLAVPDHQQEALRLNLSVAQHLLAHRAAQTAAIGEPPAG